MEPTSLECGCGTVVILTADLVTDPATGQMYAVEGVWVGTCPTCGAKFTVVLGQ
jgi:hypothetical protein